MGVKRVVAVCEDRGPANNLGPVVRQLRAAGEDVVVFARGPAAETFAQMGLEPREYASAASVSEANPALILGGIDSSCDSPPVAEIVAAGSEVPLVLISDFWGAGLARPELWKAVRTAWVCVNDPEDAKLAGRTFPLVSPVQIIVTGRPAADKFAGRPQGWVDVLRAKTRGELGIGDDEFVVLHAGQLNRTGEAFAELVETLLEIDEPVTLIGRKHPAMLKDAQWAQEEARWQEAAAWFERSCVRYLDCTGSGFDPEALTAASDVVTAMFSTMLWDAAGLRRAALAILYPEVGQTEWERVEPGAPMFQPAVLGTCALAGSRAGLVLQLGLARYGELARMLLPAQERHFRVDGGNAQRVARVVIELVAA